MQEIASTKELKLALSKADLIIVGTGLFGSTIAELATRRSGANVVMIERRDHIGGNVYANLDSETGIEVHKYGPHIFHTSNERVISYVRKFSDFSSYQHRVFASHKNIPYSLPVNLHTLGQFFGKNFSPESARLLLNKGNVEKPSNFEEAAIDAIGEELYEAFFKGYTQKQWQVDPKELPASVFNRLPIRFDFNTRYFSDKFEGIPTEGYACWVRRMLESPRISIKMETDFKLVEHLVPDHTPVVYTGAIDELFDYEFGPLGWRTLDFTTETLKMKSFQGVAQMNFPDLDVPWTRIIEHKHFVEETKQTEHTIITKEFSRIARREDEPFYPIRREIDLEVYSKYHSLLEGKKNFMVGGRLGSYAYLDMHQAISSALGLYTKELEKTLLT